MRNLLTFAGWILVGVIVAFTGRQLWLNWKGDNPKKAEVIEKHVKESVADNKKKIKEAANKAMDVAANKLHDHIAKTEPKPEPVTEPKIKETAAAKKEETVVNKDEVVAKKTEAAPKTLEEIEAETIARLAAVEETPVEKPEKLGAAKPIPPKPNGKEAAATERLARIADDNDKDEPAVKAKRVPLSAIAAREKRLERQEEVLMQRQMRIIDDLLE